MTVQAFNVGNELGQLIAQGRIPQQALTAITGIAPESLATYLNTGPGLSKAATELSQAEIARLSALAVQLTEVAAIDDDERLHAIIETLASQFELSHENVALLTRTRLEDLQAFLSDPAAVPSEFKFKLAVRVNYLFHAVLNAAPYPSRP